MVEHFIKSAKETYSLSEKKRLSHLMEKHVGRNTFAMLKHVSEQQVTVTAILIETKVQYFMPEGEDWNVIENLVKVLEPFQKTTEISTEISFQQLAV